jgi:TorA maturation chaperone TorD
MRRDPERLLNLSMLYRMLAAAYAYPDDDFHSALESGAFSAALCSGVMILDDRSVSETAERLYDAIAGLSEVDISLAEEYTALFQRKVPCSPYASRYLVPSALFRSGVLSDVVGYYQLLGVRPSRDRPDLPDHIGTQLEFLGLAAAREADALCAGDDTLANNLGEVRGQFCENFVVLWIPHFREKLDEHARLAFYPAVTDLALALLELEHPVPAEVTAGPAADPAVDDAIEDDDGTASSFDCGPV